MKLPGRLLLVSLVTLLLPWAGCRYVQEVESALRQGRAETLLASTRLVAAAAEARGDSAWTQIERWAPWRPEAEDVYVHPLARPPALDGYFSDWDLGRNALVPLRGVPDGAYAGIVAGYHGDALYVYVELGPGGETGEFAVLCEQADGRIAEYLFLPEAPGPIRPGAPGDTDPRVTGNWQATPDGYHLELRLPAGAPDGRFGLRLLWPGWPPAGTYQDEPGWKVTPRGALGAWLTEISPAGTTLALVDRAGFVLAEASGGATVPQPPGTGRSWPLLYRAMLPGADAPPTPPQAPGRRAGQHLDKAIAGEAGAARFRLDDGRLVLVAAAPVVRDGLILGAVEARQPIEPVLAVGDEAVSRLLGTSMLASLAAAVVLLGFALRLSMRIRRLSRAAAQGMTASGELATRMPGHGAGDELGDLSRSFSRLLVRVRDYNQYLKTMGSKLTHELRTPIAVMRSSLENLEARGAGEDPRVYLERARQGIERLEKIVNAIGAATRLEQAIAGAGNERFDLAALVGDLGSAYADAHPGLCIGARIQTGPCEIDGAPELIAQMLDKLVENAVDFTPAGGRILLVLSREDGKALLSVINEGSTLPGDAGDRLFESLVSARPEGDGGAHMGLGLYLARLVAAHHHGGIRATNLPDASGVAFTVALPLADSGKPASRETVS
jgi:signal transduction histidine kinase